MTVSRDQRIRNWLITIVALGGIVFETAAYRAERPFLLTLFGSMLGIPLLIRDSKRED